LRRPPEQNGTVPLFETVLKLLLVFAAQLSCGSSTFAQAPPAAEPVAEAAESAPAETAPAADPEKVGPPLETDPAIKSALALPRKEPADYFDTITWLVQLGRADLAKPILDELTKLQLTDTQRADLVAQVGSHAMLKLARTKELAPAGAQFADACMAAAAATATNPQRIAALVKQLTDASPEVRVVARNDLAAIGQQGVNATLEALARETDPQRRAALAEAVTQMSPLSDRPLLSMLGSKDTTLRREVARLLVESRVSQAAPFLASNSEQAEQTLQAAITSYVKGSPPFTPDESNQVELWFWNDTTKSLSSQRYSADEARVIWMARLASALAQLRPGNCDYERHALMTALEAVSFNSPPHVSTGAAPAIQKLLASADPALLNETLADSLAANYAYSAAAIIDELGKRGDVSILYTGNAKPSPLASALTHPNRRVRFAALQAIMAIDPASPYPGSSKVPDALTWFADSSGEKQALVAMPTNVMSTDLAGKLAAHKYLAAATNRGRDAVDMALAMADLEVILVDMDILSPDIRQVLYELRIGPATGEIPVAILAGDGRLFAAERLAAEHQRVFAFPRPQTPAAIAQIVEQLIALSPRNAVLANERLAQAADARRWLDALASSNREFYTIRRPPRLAALGATDDSIPINP
jgi:hypothetical protein